MSQLDSSSSLLVEELRARASRAPPSFAGLGGFLGVVFGVVTGGGEVGVLGTLAGIVCGWFLGRAHSLTCRVQAALLSRNA